MNDKEKKCSSKEHIDIDAIYYCQKCNINMCNKCENLHSALLPNHYSINLNKEEDEIFTGFCKEKDHPNKLEFLCKNHNQLCCVACICPANDEKYGKHGKCSICKIDTIEEEKRSKLKENIKILENLSISLEKAINEIKIKLMIKIN